MIIGVTGHRDVEQEPGELLMFARLCVARMVEHGATRILTGMARGFDQKIARAALDAGVPYAAIIPFPGQHRRWPRMDQDEYAWLCDQADELVIVSRLELNVSYIKRDQYIVDKSVELWALDSGRKSGSHTTVLYADQIGRTVRPLWEPWLRFRAERN